MNWKILHRNKQDVSSSLNWCTDLIQFLPNSHKAFFLGIHKIILRLICKGSGITKIILTVPRSETTQFQDESFNSSSKNYVVFARALTQRSTEKKRESRNISTLRFLTAFEKKYKSNLIKERLFNKWCCIKWTSVGKK